MKATKDTIVREFNPDRVKPFDHQPRKRFRGITDLAASIKKVGQIIPGKVVLLGGDLMGFDAQLIDGERRLRACKIAGVPFRAEVTDQIDTEDQQFETSLAANFGKQDHDCMEIAEALGRLQKNGRSLQEMADICGGKSTTWVAQHLSLLKLHPDVQAMLLADELQGASLAFTTACTLTNQPHSFQLKMAGKITKGRMSLAEARRMILRECQKSGLAPTKNKISPADNLSSLQACIKLMTHRLGVFVDMRGDDLRLAIEMGKVPDRYKLIKDIDELTDDLAEIADVIEKSLSKKRSA